MGYDVCKKIKSESETENIKVILISGRRCSLNAFKGMKWEPTTTTNHLNRKELLAKLKFTLNSAKPKKIFKS